MEEKEVFLNIRQFVEETETFHTYTDGLFSEKDGEYIIKWNGYNFFGEEFQNTVKVKDDFSFSVTLGVELGDVFMIKNEPLLFYNYDPDTEEGSTICFFLSELVNSLSPDGGGLIAEYSVSKEDSRAVKRRLEIMVL